MSENKAVSILVALVFRTALVYFRYLPIVLNFFFSLVWVCRIMLGRNTNLPLVQQILLVPQLPQSSFFIFVTVSEWCQLVLTQKSNPMGSTTEASQSSNGWAGTSSATGVQSVPPVAHLPSSCPPPRPQRAFLCLSGTYFTVLLVPLHQVGLLERCGVAAHGPFYFEVKASSAWATINSWGSNTFSGHKCFLTEWVS